MRETKEIEKESVGIAMRIKIEKLRMKNLKMVIISSWRGKKEGTPGMPEPDLLKSYYHHHQFNLSLWCSR